MYCDRVGPGNSMTADLTAFFQGIPDVQRIALRALLVGIGQLSVIVRRVEEFDGQEDDDIGVEVEDGRRFAVRADGEVRTYPSE